MSEKPKGFTVNDRRHFTPDGSPRDGAREGSVSAPVASPATAPDPDEGPPEAVPDAVDFGGFLASLGAQASLLLGLGSESGEKPQVDLAGARQIVSVLEMLKDKSQGRRTAEEDRLLDGILFELRLAWVKRARGGTA